MDKYDEELLNLMKKKGINMHYSMSKETKAALTELKSDINNIKNNDLHELKESMGSMKDDVNELKMGQVQVTNDVAWLKKFFWIVATASVGGLIAGILNLLKTAT